MTDYKTPGSGPIGDAEGRRRWAEIYRLILAWGAEDVASESDSLAGVNTPAEEPDIQMKG